MRQLPDGSIDAEVRAGGDLAVAAKLLYGFCFERVRLPAPKLSYEPRHSAQCTACAAMWIASKSGEVMRIDLPTPDRPLGQSRLPGTREVRAVCHVHDGTPFGDSARSFLLIGRDNGVLEIVSDRDWKRNAEVLDKAAAAAATPAAAARRAPRPLRGFHLDTWYDQRKNATIPVTAGFARGKYRTPRYALDITALAVFPRPGQPGTSDIVVGTRYPWLYVIEVAGGGMRIRTRIHAPGWIQWIIGPQGDDDRVMCISRGGDVVRFPRRKLTRGADPTTTKLPLLPTAVLAFDYGSLLIGTATGLFLLGENHAQAISVPVTRKPILCLTTAQLHDDNGTHDYITMGLANARLHVVHRELLSALAHGDKRCEGRSHYLAIETTDAVLEVQTIRDDNGQGHTAYLLAALRDQSLCLYRVTTQLTQRAAVRKLWRAYVLQTTGTGRGGTPPFSDEIAAARADPPSDRDQPAWTYMVVDEVLPRLCEAALSSEQREAVVRVACHLADRADRRGLYRLSATLGKLTGNDIDHLLRLSRRVLRAASHGDGHHWTAFYEFHLRALDDIAPKLKRGARVRLVSWARFVRKHILLGGTFAAKQLGLRALVEQNYRGHKYLDALVYHSRLAQTGYDLLWSAVASAEVVELHMIDCRSRPLRGARYLLVVLVTAEAKLAFLDGATGDSLEISHRSARHKLLELFPVPGGRPARGRGLAARTFASAIARDHDRIRLVVSCTAPGAQRPALAILDLEWSGSPDSPVTVRGDLRPAITVVRPMRELPAARRLAEPHAPHVFAVAPLPGDFDAFVVGLDSPTSPVGLLRGTPKGWELALGTDPGMTESQRHEIDDDLPSETPVRAIAVVAMDEPPSRYLAVAGSDDGAVRAISFDHGDAAETWRITRWHQMTAAVTDVVLGRLDDATAGRDRDRSLCTCYLGTAAGELFALSVVAPGTSGAGATLPFGAHDAELLWRDEYDGPILALRLWRTPLYPRHDVLITASEKGRVCFYHHAARTTGGDRDTVSASLNHLFRGMRFERIGMPARLRALAIAEDGREVVAASPGGRLHLANLMYLRNSDLRHDPEPDPPEAPPAPDSQLPEDMWERLHHLYAATHHDWLGNAADRIDGKLDLLDLIRLAGGAMATYVLRRRLRYHHSESWKQIAAADLPASAEHRLRSLDPENPEHGVRIKVVLQTLCREFLLDRHQDIAAQIVASPTPAWFRPAQVAAVCEVVAEQLAGKLACSRRLRIAAITELLRIPVLWYMAREDEHGRATKRAVESALQRCLLDEDLQVRFEALRQLAVMLGNVEAIAARHGRAVIEALFPAGLKSASWLLEPVGAGLHQLPGLSRRSAMVGRAWYYIAALLPLFRIFPDSTLTLCDYLVRLGLGLRPVSICHHLLRRHDADLACSRIESLYLISLMRQQSPRDAFLERYDTRHSGHGALRSALRLPGQPGLPPARGQRDPTWYELDDVTMAERRLDLLDRLAQMWSATTPAEIAGYKALLPPDAPVVRKAPLGQLAGVVEDLALIACDLAERATEAAAIKRLAELGAQHGSGVPGKSELIAPVRRVVANIVQLWQKIWDPTPPAPGTPIGAYLLGDSIGAGQFGTVFHVAAPVEDGNRVIKVVRNLRSASIAALFVRGAELTERLCTDARDGAYIVPINAILRSAPYPSYVMPKYGGVLQYELEHEYAGVATPPEWAERVAWHIGRALRAAHACGHYHGNVTPSNILFDDHRTSPVFRLADFELTDPVEHAAARAPVIADIAPVGARDEAASAVADRQWDDIVALSLIVCRMLTGKDVDLHAPQGLDATRVGLRQLTRGPSDKSPLVETLLRVLSPKRAGFGIEDFLVALASSRKRPALPILFLGANPPGTGRLGLNEEVKLIDRRLRMTSYRDAYELERCLDVRADELQELMLKHNPGIVHVSGHGTPDGQLVFVDRNGHSAPIPVKRLEGMFKTVAKQVRCVVLSACYSKAQAAAIRKSISVVIGMDDAILDHDAIAFAGEFYAALGHGATVKRAFEQGCNQIVSERARRDSARRDCVLLEPPPESLPLPVLIGSTVPAARLRFAPPSGDPQPATRTPRTARRRTRR